MYIYLCVCNVYNMYICIYSYMCVYNVYNIYIMYIKCSMRHKKLGKM